MRSTLFVSYSGALGGAERALLQVIAGVGGERWLACPEGRLAHTARAAGVRHVPLRQRRLEIRTRRTDPILAPLRLVGHGLGHDLLGPRRDVRVLDGWPDRGGRKFNDDGAAKFVGVDLLVPLEHRTCECAVGEHHNGATDQPAPQVGHIFDRQRDHGPATFSSPTSAIFR